jgi:hypothetical protein
MNTDTYAALPRDVLVDLGPDRVRIDPTIPTGMVDVTGQGRVTRMPINAFVRARRKVRKAERRNRKAGRR